MKNSFKIMLFIILVTTVITSCKRSFNDLYNNENKPLAVPAALLFNGVLNDMYEAPYTSKEKWSQFFITNYAYYGDNRYDFGPGDDYYGTLKNVVKMEEEAKGVGLPDGNVYSAIAKFFKAYLFSKMTLEMGDLPMTGALKGIDNLTPAYDSQKKIFLQSFSWLDSANTELGALIAVQDNNLKGDIYYGNDLTKWRKLANTYHLRLLIELSKQAGDADLNLSSQFQAILGNKTNYPVMEDMSDNLQYAFTHPTNDYPNNPGNFGFNALRDNCSATYVGLLTSLKDPRVFVTSEPATALVSGGTSPTSFDAFVGADPGEDLGTMYQKANAGEYSLLNRWRYYQTYTGEPGIQVGYPEMLFNIAEAINRGWISSGPLGTAEDYYMAGIKASMSFYGIPETGSFNVYFLQSGSPGSTAVYNTYSVNVDFNTYYNQAFVKYAGDNETGLTEILQQKYIALYRHSGLEGYYQFRRTGVPVFTTGPGTGNSARIPLRFQYPANEKTANAENYQTALQSQYGGNDDINGTMWLLK
ncbi:MAG: SusD/RagB family nutrient-binding outer membrane lipoprotein [Chitinophagales bacterium]